MYQQNQNASNFQNQNARNFQNISLGNQQNRQFQNNMFPLGNFQNMYRSQLPLSHHGGNQIPQNQLTPARFNVVAMETNNLNSENVFNQRQSTAHGFEHLSNNMSSSIVRPVESNTNHGTNFHRFANIPQHNAPTQFASPAVLIPQNNKNFSAQRRIEANTSQSVTRGSASERLETGSVSIADTIRTVTWEPVKKNENEKIRIFTGTAEKVLKWHKNYKDYFCFYELVASITSIQEGTVRLQKILLLRDKKGPVIQVIHYVNDHIDIENFCVGQMLRCVGHMVGPNILHGLSIREATLDEVTTIRRMSYISDHAITKVHAKP